MRKNIIRSIYNVLLIIIAMSMLNGGVAFAGEEGENKIDINQATVKELTKLPGIGKKKAEAIVAHRNENGKFKSVDDLKKVEGIGKKSLEKIKGYLMVEGG
jgi:competence protein ComEA